MLTKLLELKEVKKSYPSPEGGNLEILDGINLSLFSGEAVAIIGESGCGKSTLLNVTALLTQKDSGEIYYSGQDVDKLTKSEITKLRKSSMGFVFQSSLLLEDFSAEENVALPLLINGYSKKESKQRARELLEQFSLARKGKYRPKELSGGERQRIAILRSIAANPKIIFADEPTGALDEKSADVVESLLLKSVKEGGEGLLLVTHNKEFAAKCDRVLVLKGGKIG